MAWHGLRPVRLTSRLEMVDLDWNAATATDLNRLIDPFEKPVAFGPHVGDIDTAVGRHHFCKFN